MLSRRSAAQQLLAGAVLALALATDCAPLAAAGDAGADAAVVFPVVLNDRVRPFLERFQGAQARAIALALQRARRYVSVIRDVLREKGLPEDLVGLAFIESRVDPAATSPANAAGIWQLLPSTARVYGMRTTPWLDERRDPEKSTRGAAEHLKRLRLRFGSWPLALAAYNAGEGTIQHAIAEQGTRDFWRLRLPRETELFVPAVMAMTIFTRDPMRYGLLVPAEERYPTEFLRVDRPTEIRLIAQVTGTTAEQLQELNPELLAPITPPDHPRYPLRIPRGLAPMARDPLTRIPPHEGAGWILHRVRKGETPAGIARRHAIPTRELCEMNGLASSDVLKPGRTILVPAVPEGRPVAG